MRDLTLPIQSTNDIAGLEEWVETLSVEDALMFHGWCSFALELTRKRLSDWDSKE